MKVISVQQPFASMIVAGLKREEFRSYPTQIRERIAIHASARIMPWSREAATRAILRKLQVDSVDELPLGCIVGTVDLVGCSGEEEDYAWKLARPMALLDPIPAKGAAAWWHYNGQIA